MTFQQGSTGPEVSQIQAQLKVLGFYEEPVDGDFGPATQVAVIQFQSSKALSADGIVGPLTWAALFTGSVVPVPVDAGDLPTRCLSLTGSFETGQRPPGCFAAIAGDFDGQGMSFGALQWNFGQSSLQPLLQQMDQAHSDVIDQLFGNDASELRSVLTKSHPDQMTWIRSIQDGGHHIQQPWRDQFSALGHSGEFQALEVKAATQRYEEAKSWCGTYNVQSERAVALMFDIRVQDGSIAASTRDQILQDFQNLQPSGDPAQDEVNRLVIIANRRADAVHGPFQADVRARKLCIANGQGTVHGANYDLETQFGITLAVAT